MHNIPRCLIQFEILRLFHENIPFSCVIEKTASFTTSFSDQNPLKYPYLTMKRAHGCIDTFEDHKENIDPDAMEISPKKPNEPMSPCKRQKIGLHGHEIPMYKRRVLSKMNSEPNLHANGNMFQRFQFGLQKNNQNRRSTEKRSPLTTIHSEDSMDSVTDSKPFEQNQWPHFDRSVQSMDEKQRGQVSQLNLCEIDQEGMNSQSGDSPKLFQGNSGRHSQLTIQHCHPDIRNTKSSADLSPMSPGVFCIRTPFENTLNIETVSDSSIHDCCTISGETMNKILNNRPENLVVVDCRFPFEYNGGHIKGALNLYTPDLLEQYFFQDNKARLPNAVIVFHCEFSKNRGPKMYRFLREIDRKNNGANYPLLDYNNIYLLQGGYKNWYESGRYLEHCIPQHYTPMDDECFAVQLKAYWSEMKKRWRIKKKGRVGLRRTRSVGSLLNI